MPVASFNNQHPKTKSKVTTNKDNNIMPDISTTERAKTVNLDLEPTGTVRAKPIKILIMELAGKIYSLEVELKESISSIKAKIEKMCRIPVRRQILFHASRLLGDRVKLSECYIRDGSIISLFINPQAT